MINPTIEKRFEIFIKSCKNISKVFNEFAQAMDELDNKIKSYEQMQSMANANRKKR